VRAGDVEADVGAYLNRLSDYLFAAARTAVRAASASER
jgi:cob(I)alamin adenosyltransferase